MPYYTAVSEVWLVITAALGAELERIFHLMEHFASDMSCLLGWLIPF